MKKYIIYKITNIINNNIYVGCHITENINDNYMGSGTNIIKDIKKYGRQNFKKDILFEFNNELDMLNKEKEIVNEDFIARKDTHNIIVGDSNLSTTGCIVVKDINGNTMMVHNTDERYLSGELVGNCKGKVVVKDKNDNIMQISIYDERYLSGELVGVCKGKIMVYDSNNNLCYVNKNDPKYISGEFVSARKNFIIVKDKNGNKFCTDKDDMRVISGELVSES